MEYTPSTTGHLYQNRCASLKLNNIHIKIKSNTTETFSVLKLIRNETQEMNREQQMQNGIQLQYSLVTPCVLLWCFAILLLQLHSLLLLSLSVHFLCIYLVSVRMRKLP